VIQERSTGTSPAQRARSAYVDAVARTNVRLGVDNIRRRSTILVDLEKKGTIQIAAAMYDLATGVVDFV
jgi:carbonic anhydrase